MLLPLAFGVGNPADWIIIAAVALVIFGPKKMPELGRQIGQAMREFRKVTDELTGVVHSVQEEVHSVYKPVLSPPAVSTATSSATVEQAITHKPYDQEPEPLPAIAESIETKSGNPSRGLSLSTLPPEASATTETGTKG